MIAINRERVETLITKYSSKITNQKSAIVRRLNALLVDLKNPTQRRYVEELLLEKDNLITGSQVKILGLQKHFDGILIIDPTKKRHVTFKNKILKALGYSNHRNTFLPEYFKDLGIKSCVYCNAQLCIAVNEDNGDVTAKFEVDHYISKDKYPCLSVALFNLYPACKSCNNIKGVKRVNFDLYKEKKDLGKSSFTFELLDKDTTVAKYITKPDASLINIAFNEPNVVAPVKKFDAVFSIVEIYNTQIDIVEDLIIKNHIYDNSYKQDLKDKFPKLFPDDKTLNQFILGNYTEDIEIHNRPMSKFMQDIARQLGLIE